MRTKIGRRIMSQSPRSASIHVDQVDLSLSVTPVAVRDARAVGRPSRMIFLPPVGTGDIRLIASVRVHYEEIEGPIPIADERDLRSFHRCTLLDGRCQIAARKTSGSGRGAWADCLRSLVARVRYGIIRKRQLWTCTNGTYT